MARTKMPILPILLFYAYHNYFQQSRDRINQSIPQISPAITYPRVGEVANKHFILCAVIEFPIHYIWYIRFVYLGFMRTISLNCIGRNQAVFPHDTVDPASGDRISDFFVLPWFFWFHIPSGFLRTPQQRCHYKDLFWVLRPSYPLSYSTFDDWSLGMCTWRKQDIYVYSHW